MFEYLNFQIILGAEAENKVASRIFLEKKALRHFNF